MTNPALDHAEKLADELAAYIARTTRPIPARVPRHGAANDARYHTTATLRVAR